MRVLVTATKLRRRTAQAVSTPSAEGQSAKARRASWKAPPQRAARPSVRCSTPNPVRSGEEVEVQTSYQWQSCNEAGLECHDIPQAGPQGGNTCLQKTTTGEAAASAGRSKQQGRLRRSNLLPQRGKDRRGHRVLLSTLAPSTTGEAQSGKTLTAHAGSWLGGEALSSTYQWQSCNSYGVACENISGATASSTYTVAAAVVGHTLRVPPPFVTDSEAEHSASQVSAPTEPVAARRRPRACKTSAGKSRAQALSATR